MPALVAENSYFDKTGLLGRRPGGRDLDRHNGKPTGSTPPALVPMQRPVLVRTSSRAAYKVALLPKYYNGYSIQMQVANQINYT